jgi:hypothetical protein
MISTPHLVINNKVLARSSGKDFIYLKSLLTRSTEYILIVLIRMPLFDCLEYARLSFYI